jgi:hypothetical protein
MRHRLAGMGPGIRDGNHREHEQEDEQASERQKDHVDHGSPPHNAVTRL